MRRLFSRVIDGLGDARRLPCAGFQTHIHARPAEVLFNAYGGRGMKSSIKGKPKAKPGPKVPDYCDVEPCRDADGAPVWPADESAIGRARKFITEW